MKQTTGMIAMTVMKERIKQNIYLSGLLTKRQPLRRMAASMRNAPFAITRKQL